ncbi:hypothetical protein Taro_015240, partial [Colocasia esculenta]|nr:hypothetical protein [Colocasia esculenta]
VSPRISDTRIPREIRANRLPPVHSQPHSRSSSSSSRHQDEHHHPLPCSASTTTVAASQQLLVSYSSADGARHRGPRRRHRRASDPIKTLVCYPLDMARLSRGRDHALLGHDPHDPFADADVDFSDVFGGPPRRASISRAGLGPGESAGGMGAGVGEDDAAAPRRAWSCSLGEMPVFGGTRSPARRSRQEGNSFFDDILRANESPRKLERDVFSSNPSSMVLSPARPLPPASDVFGRGSALPAQLSLSTRPLKGSDYLAYGPHTPDVAYRNGKSTSNVLGSSPVASVPASYRRLVQTRDNPKSDTHVSFKESALLYTTPHSQRRSLEATKIASIETNDPVRQLRKDSSGVQVQSDYGYFHFSMHKWASADVTLVMPYNLRERTKSGTKASGVSIQIPQSADSPTDKCMLHGNFHALCDLKDKSQSSGPAAEENRSVNLTREVKEGAAASPDTDSVRTYITDKSGVPVKARKPEPKNLSQLLNNFSDEEGDKQRTGQTRNEESMVVDYNTKMDDVHGAANVEQTISEYMFGSHAGKCVKKLPDASAAREDKIVGSQVKRKVKEFIKIFNQEPAPRSDENIENQARKPRTRNEARGRLDAYVANADEHEKEKVDKETLTTSPMAVCPHIPCGRIPKVGLTFELPSAFHKLGLHCQDQIPATPDASFSNIEEAYIENIDECLAESPYYTLPLIPPLGYQVEDKQNEVAGAGAYQDEIKKSDAKIREWSRGKEGNIRSLLATLQYVLWPGSGWKPVPLVDIIEGASVRRAYQKALLCLHPDKLQQKGAEMHQKYIAEKVFDILQVDSFDFCCLAQFIQIFLI